MPDVEIYCDAVERFYQNRTQERIELRRPLLAPSATAAAWIRSADNETKDCAR